MQSSDNSQFPLVGIDSSGKVLAWDRSNIDVPNAIGGAIQVKFDDEFVMGFEKHRS